METVLDSVQALQLPPDDRNVRVVEYDPELFTMKSPYRLLIEISMFSGRTRETKKLLYRNIVENLFEKLNINKDTVFIVINEQPLGNWGIKGGIPADEVNLGFTVNR
jgi:4-oxalocrotonate tautomerase family enzyme